MGKIFAGSAPRVEYVSNNNAELEANKKADEERKKALDRQRRGMESTIQTSYTGVLEPKNMELNRKRLLGE